MAALPFPMAGAWLVAGAGEQPCPQSSERSLTNSAVTMPSRHSATT